MLMMSEGECNVPGCRWLGRQGTSLLDCCASVSFGNETRILQINKTCFLITKIILVGCNGLSFWQQFNLGVCIST